MHDGFDVAYAVDHGNGGDDNLLLSLHYEGTMEWNSTFLLWARNDSVAHKIPQNQLQIGFKTYGKGHELSIL